jgi:ABC-2 type transport system permease protein
MGRLDPHRLWAMARKEARQLQRDPRSLVMAFALPVILVLIFGFAISWDVTDIPLAVMDQDHTQRSRELVDAFTSSGYFRLVDPPPDYAAADGWLERARARVILVIHPGFAARLEAGRPAPVQALVDGADANTAGIAVNYAQGIATAYSARVFRELRSSAQPPSLVEPEIRIWYNETLASRNSIVPGLIAVVMMIIAAMLTSLTIAREWERGTMEQLAATPIHPLEVVLGKLVPYVGIGLVDILVTLALGLAVFQVPLRGSLAFLLGCSLLFLLGAFGVGLFISAALRSQLLATQVSVLATYLPSFLLSGFAFDLAGLPKVLQLLSLLVPARYYVTIIKGVFLKGIGPAVLWPQLLALTLFAAIGLGLATRSFRKELE